MITNHAVKLARATLDRLPADVGRPGYDLVSVRSGIVHFGPGAFHRAHQGAFVDRLLSHDPRWGITEVSLRSGEVTAKLAGQDGLYALAVLEAEPRFQVIGAVAGWIGPGEGSALLAKLRDPAIAVVTSTVTEKGYCLDGAGALDFVHPDIVHDLADAARPLSLIGWLVRALGARREDGVAPFATIPCDNMPDNGARLARAVEAFARRLDPGLADWIAGEARFASTMVDAITPASDAALLDRVELATGLRDGAAVQREGFAQW